MKTLTITLNTKNLLSATSVANNFTSKDGDFEGKIVLVGNDSKLQLKATNNIETIVLKGIEFVSSDLTEDSFLPLTIECKKLLTVLKAAKTEEVHIELQEELIVLKSGRSRVKIATTAIVQDIEIENQGESFDFSSYIGSMKQMLHAVDSNNSKYELNGLLLSSKDKVLNLVGTDTKKLAVSTFETSLDDIEIIIPKESIKNIAKLFGGFEVVGTCDDISLSMVTDHVSYSTKLINGSFPQWQRIMPKSFAQNVAMPRKALITLLEEASIFNQEIILEIKNNKIRLTDFDKNTEIVEDFVSDTNIRFGADAKALLNFLASYEDENIQICFNENNQPIVLVANTSYKEVIMPIIIPEVQTTEDEEEYEVAA